MSTGNYETRLMLNLQIIKDNLEDDYNITCFNGLHDEQKLTGACIYYGQQDLDSSCVYVARAEVFERMPVEAEDIFWISVGELKKPEMFQNRVWMEVEEAPWEEVFNRVQTVFFHYEAWTRRLAHILNNGGGLRELCVAAMDFFRNPLYIHDEHFNVLAMSTWVVGMTNFAVDAETGNVAVPLEKIQSFKVNPEYLKTLLTHGAQMWNPSYNSHRVLYVNLWERENQYRGRFLINELQSSIKPSDFLMAEYFSNILIEGLENNLFKSSSDKSFEVLLMRLLKGETLEEAYLLDRLRMMGWERRHTYVCCKIELGTKKNEIMSAHQICSTMDILLKKSVSFPLENEVYTVCNLTVSGYSQKEYLEKLAHLCQITEVTVGISNPFQDFLKLKEYYHQAFRAVELGEKRGRTGCCILFSDHVLEYIIGHCTKEFSPDSVCAEAVLKLREMDREKHTEYVETLRIFLDNNCQQTAAAQAMYIHRSTLSYRLRKIQEFTGIDFEDADMRLYVQISLKLIEQKRKP